jgi:hypothetical protein
MTKISCIGLAFGEVDYQRIRNNAQGKTRCNQGQYYEKAQVKAEPEEQPPVLAIIYFHITRLHLSF